MEQDDTRNRDGYYRGVDVLLSFKETGSTTSESEMDIKMDKTSEPDLYRVALMMDEWIAQENVAYGAILREKNDVIQDLQYKLANAMSSANRMANIIIEQDVQLDTLLPRRTLYWSIGEDLNGTPIPVLNNRIIDLTAEEEMSDIEDDLMEYLMHL